MAAGYRFPPEPPASCLANDTYEAVMTLTLAGGSGVAQVEGARGALLKFVRELTEHLKTSNAACGAHILTGRKVCAAGALLLLVHHSEIKTGTEFDLSLGLSAKDGLMLEVTLPIEPTRSR